MQIPAKLMLATAGFIFLLSPLGASACTAFAANGADYVSGGGSLVAKVRDEVMKGQEVKIVHPKDGYSYAGLFAGKRKTFNVGFNSAGLAVFRTAASSLPKSLRVAAKHFRKDGLSAPEYMIRNFASVDEVLSHPEVFMEPINYVLADRHKVTVVEVYPDGSRKVKTTVNGVDSHTNHYLFAEIDGQKVGRSSPVRLARINDLMEKATKPMTREDFVRMTEDRHDGPNKSIFRTGKTDDPEGLSTLATSVISISPDGFCRMNLKWRDKIDDKNSWQNTEFTTDDLKKGSAGH